MEIKRILIVPLIVAAVLLAGCNGTNKTVGGFVCNYRGGNTGLVVELLDNSTITLYPNDTVEVDFVVENMGEQTATNIQYKLLGLTAYAIGKEGKIRNLEPEDSEYGNITFQLQASKISSQELNGKIKISYNYTTTGQIGLCLINSNSEVPEKQRVCSKTKYAPHVCQSGAPVQITNVVLENRKGKAYLSFVISNVGSGDIVSTNNKYKYVKINELEIVSGNTTFNLLESRACGSRIESDGKVRIVGRSSRVIRCTIDFNKLQAKFDLEPNDFEYGVQLFLRFNITYGYEQSVPIKLIIVGDEE